MDHPDGLGGVALGLQMEGNEVGAAFFEVGDIFLRLTDHDVDIKKQAANGADAPDDRHPEGDIRHKVAVHHVDMEPVGAALFYAVQFVGQAGKIRRKHGGGDEHGGGFLFSVNGKMWVFTRWVQGPHTGARCLF